MLTNAALDLDALMAAGKERMYDDALPEDQQGYLAPGVGNLERLVVMTGDLLYQFSQNGIGGWVGNYLECYQEIDLPRRVAAAVALHCDVDPEMADFVIDTMAAIARLTLSSDADEVDAGEEDGKDDPAWADVSWRWEVWCGLERRVERLLKAVCQRWDAALDPFAADLTPWPRDLLTAAPAPAKHPTAPHYPRIAVGFTRDGQGCAFLDENVANGMAPDYMTISGAVSWALWRSGVPVADIRRFQRDLDRHRDRMAKTVGTWVNVDGQGEAGVEALHAALNPAHPWQTLLGVDKRRARTVRYVFCASPEQATGLVRALDVPIWHVVYEPGSRADPRADLTASVGICFGVAGMQDGHVARCGTEEDLLVAIRSGMRGGLQDMVIELRAEVEGEAAIRHIAGMSLYGIAIAFVGASQAFQERLRAMRQDIGITDADKTEAWDVVAFNAIGRGPSFSGRTIH